jgi:methionine--tRNA ligase beta chain
MDNETPEVLATLADFQKIKLRVGTVRSAEALPHSEKLLKLTVDIGGEARQILAGIKKSYTPEQLVGKQVVVLANLEPKKLAGELSEGMLLAASNESEGPILLSPEASIESGSEVR